MTSLEASYAHCRRVARRRARNFYYAFVLLDRTRRDAVCSIYAFMRRCDDLSDEPGATPAALDDWRLHLDAALAGNYGPDPVWPAFHHTVRRYSIPHAYFHDMIDGVASDLVRTSFATFDELYRYCYQVASVAGLSLIHVLGFRSPEALPLAEKCGVAFQLTNILRDLSEDFARGRLYLPREDLDRFGVAELADSGPMLALLRFEAARARRYYQEAAPLPAFVDPDCRASLAALIDIYSRLLDRIERAGCDVLRTRVRLSAFQKSAILVRALWRSRR